MKSEEQILMEALALAQQRLAEVTEDRDALVDALSEVRAADDDAKQRRIDELESELESRRKVIECLEDGLERKDKVICALESHAGDLLDACEENKRLHEEREALLKELEDELAEKLKRIQELEAYRGVDRKCISDLEAENAKLHEESRKGRTPEETEAFIRSVQQQKRINELEAELAQKRSELASTPDLLPEDSHKEIYWTLHFDRFGTETFQQWYSVDSYRKHGDQYKPLYRVRLERVP